jgi:hypothetical protein
MVGHTPGSDIRLEARPAKELGFDAIMLHDDDAVQTSTRNQNSKFAKRQSN